MYVGSLSYLIFEHPDRAFPLTAVFFVCFGMQSSESNSQIKIRLFVPKRTKKPKDSAPSDSVGRGTAPAVAGVNKKKGREK